jgi:hypothetical protein
MLGVTEEGRERVSANAGWTAASDAGVKGGGEERLKSETNFNK